MYKYRDNYGNFVAKEALRWLLDRSILSNSLKEPSLLGLRFAICVFFGF